MEGRRVDAVRQLGRPPRGPSWPNRDEAALVVLNEYELPLVPVLARMEHAGIGVDRASTSKIMGERPAHHGSPSWRGRSTIWPEEPFNVNSTDQLRVPSSSNKLELPVTKKTSTGKPSTDASVLKKLDHPLVTAFLQYRELEKLRSTYVDGYLPLDPPRRADPDPVQPDGGHHRPSLIGQPQPAEHPGAVRVGQ